LGRVLRVGLCKFLWWFFMSKFLLVRCECGSESVVFGDSKTDVFCAACGNEMVRSSGGRAKINCKVEKVLG